MLVARITHEHRHEGDVAELAACSLLKLRIRYYVAQPLLKREAVARRSVIASTVHGNPRRDALYTHPARRLHRPG